MVSHLSFHFISCSRWKTRRPSDDRDCWDCIELRIDHWSAQLPRLVEAYLEFRSCDSADGFPTLDGNEQATTLPLGSIQDIELVDIFCKSLQSVSIMIILLPHCEGRCKATLVAHQYHLFPSENLIYHGYIGCPLVFPTLAISISTLDAFRQFHQVCPHFSIQTQCKALCHLQHVSQFLCNWSVAT